MTNNPKNRQQWIFDLLKVESLNYVETWAKYGQMWGKGKTTFDKDWNIANKLANDYHNRLNKAKEDKSIEAEVKVLESGLKLKNDRLLELQNQYEKLEDELATNKTVVSTFHEGSLVTDYRVLTPLEKAKLHQVIKELRAEISKIEGDYAPTKQDLNVKGITPQKVVFK